MGANSEVASASAVTLVTTAETVIAVTSINQTNNPGGQGVLVRGSVNVTAGAGTTAVVVRVRTGSTTAGTLIGVAETDTLAAANSESLPFDFLDSSANALNGNVQYCVTVQQTGATGNGTANYGLIQMMPVTGVS